MRLLKFLLRDEEGRRKKQTQKAVGKMTPGRAARKATPLGVLMFPLLPKQELAIAKRQALPGDVGPLGTCWHFLQQMIALSFISRATRHPAMPGQSSGLV